MWSFVSSKTAGLGGTFMPPVAWEHLRSKSLKVPLLLELASNDSWTWEDKTRTTLINCIPPFLNRTDEAIRSHRFLRYSKNLIFLFIVPVTGCVLTVQRTLTGKATDCLHAEAFKLLCKAYKKFLLIMDGPAITTDPFAHTQCFLDRISDEVQQLAGISQWQRYIPYPKVIETTRSVNLHPSLLTSRHELCFIALATIGNGLSCVKKAQKPSKNPGWRNAKGQAKAHYASIVRRIIDNLRWRQS